MVSRTPAEARNALAAKTFLRQVTKGGLVRPTVSLGPEDRANELVMRRANARKALRNLEPLVNGAKAFKETARSRREAELLTDTTLAAELSRANVVITLAQELGDTFEAVADDSAALFDVMRAANQLARAAEQVLFVSLTRNPGKGSKTELFMTPGQYLGGDNELTSVQSYVGRVQLEVFDEVTGIIAETAGKANVRLVGFETLLAVSQAEAGLDSGVC